MKVLDLRCAQGHGFEGWFASEDDYCAQLQRQLIACPMCGDHGIVRMPSAPRLNLSGAREPAATVSSAPSSSSNPSPSPNPAGQPATPPSMHAMGPGLQAAWMQAVRHLMANTEDVGERFAEEARRIHYGETQQRGIRGQTTDEERQALQDEGIEVVAIPVPAALKGPVQ